MIVPTTQIVTPYDAYRIALETAPFSVAAARITDLAWWVPPTPGHLLVTLTLWPGLEAWALRIRERVRAVLVDAAPANIHVEVEVA